MKNAIILHGMPSKEEFLNPENPPESDMHWLSWAQKQLTIRGILTQNPELPDAYAPDYKKWLHVFEQFDISENTHLIGHSCGAGFLVRWLSENQRKVGKVALVAPFLDPGGEVASDFFNFTMNDSLTQQTDGICIFYSTDDAQEILTSVKHILTAYPTIHTKQFTDKKHFTFNDMKTNKFPELIDYLLS